jgi:hypothetical protein
MLESWLSPGAEGLEVGQGVKKCYANGESPWRRNRFEL